MAVAALAGHKVWSIHIGGVYAGREGNVVRTVLGSCIAVCLRDTVNGVGGMNHFMLPGSGHEPSASTRYGVHAMELLINQCMALGADRNRLEAKVFGGGHVLRMKEHAENVPSRNIRFALNFLETEKIPITRQDVGGYAAREVYFFPGTGRILLRRLTETGLGCEKTILAEEQSLRRRFIEYRPGEDDNIIIF
jgi:chemotaxis protein CheD